MIDAEYIYQGKELDLFKHAENWKRYWSAHVRPFLGKCVLEVGAGTGVNTPFINTLAIEWVCLEPDRNMAAIIEERQRETKLAGTRTVAGLISDLPRAPSFDSIVYIDVLEHIEDDFSEIAEASARLRPNGTLIVLSPAHQWLFNAFDAAIGHYRRYASKDIRALTRPELELISLRQLDSVGTLVSIGNSIFLKSKVPTLSQILLWDRVMVPISRLLDPLLGYRFGKSIVAVWRRH